MLEKTYGIYDQRTLYYSFKLSTILQKQGRLRAAKIMARQHLEVLQKQEVYDEARVHAAFHLLGTVLCDQGLYDDGVGLLKRTLEFRKRVFGDEHPNTLASMICLAQAYNGQGLKNEARELTLHVVYMNQKILGEGYLEMLLSM